MKYLSLCFTFLLISFSFNSADCTTYYVDFNDGNDSNTGSEPGSAWQHCPGDVNAEDVPSGVVLQPEDTVLFKGGVIYRGSIDVMSSGDENKKIVFRGDAWPGLEGVKAIIDGSEILTDWSFEGDNIYSANIPVIFDEEASPISFNLHEYNYVSEQDNFLWLSQTPNPEDPFFNSDLGTFLPVSNENITRTSITDVSFFSQSDENYWDNSYILIWINPNLVVPREILSFNPSTNTITFEDLGENAIYPDARDQYYSIYNSIHALDTCGEYYVNKEENKIYIYPENPAAIDSSITYSARKYGFNISSESHLRFEGFVIRKYSGEGLRDGIGIGCISGAHINIDDIEIMNNEIYHNRHTNGGYGGIFVSSVTNCHIKGNTVSYCPDNRGIFVTGAFNAIIEDNLVLRSGSTSIGMYTCENSQIISNTVSESKGDHANGITMYIASKNVLVAGNKLFDCNSPITFQDGGNFYFINNLVDANEGGSNVNEWGRTSRGPWEYGEIVFLNNTFVRNNRNAAVNIGSGAEPLVVNEALTIPGNTYVFFNNIVDGGAGNEAIYRDYNIYTGLAWSQEERYGWSLETNEELIEDLGSIFNEPANTDFSLPENSPAINSGTNVMGYYPFEVFPDYNFFTDIEGKIRPQDGNIDIGAYEYGEIFISDSGFYPVYGDTPEISLFPNPVHHQLYVFVQNIDIDGASMKFYSIDGKLRLEKEIESLFFNFDISSLPSGLYCVVIQNNTTGKSYRKLVKE